MQNTLHVLLSVTKSLRYIFRCLRRFSCIIVYTTNKVITVSRMMTLDVITCFQGVYVLQDNKFKLLTQLSSDKQYLEAAPQVCH